MSKILLGTKLGMTQLWNDKGRLIGGTVIGAKSNIVVKSGEKTLLATEKPGKTTKAQKYLADKIKATKKVWVKEVKDLEEGEINVSQFQIGETVKISGVTKGKGFAGGMKRHGFHGGPATHGGDNRRGPGSIGAQRPQRVVKGQKMAGHMGAVKFTQRGGKVIAINEAENIIVVSGNVPGPKNSQVILQSQ